LSFFLIFGRFFKKGLLKAANQMKKKSFRRLGKAKIVVYSDLDFENAAFALHAGLCGANLTHSANAAKRALLFFSGHCPIRLNQNREKP